VQRAQAVLQAVSAVQDGSSPSSDPGVLDLAPPPSPVLRIIIDNMFYPVTLDVLQQVGTLGGQHFVMVTREPSVMKTCCHGDQGTC
jgi:hypothetical protein